MTKTIIISVVITLALVAAANRTAIGKKALTGV